jgi:hypothetical protein
MAENQGDQSQQPEQELNEVQQRQAQYLRMQQTTGSFFKPNLNWSVAGSLWPRHSAETIPAPGPEQGSQQISGLHAGLMGRGQQPTGLRGPQYMPGPASPVERNPLDDAMTYYRNLHSGGTNMPSKADTVRQWSDGNGNIGGKQ